MTRYLLDTNILSYMARDRTSQPWQYLKELKPGESACISAITQAEILFGLAKRPQSSRLEQALNALLARLDILPWDSSAAHAYAALRAHNERVGRTIGSFDLLIAAHALAEDATLVTNDNAFSNLKANLRIVNWTL